MKKKLRRLWKIFWLSCVTAMFFALGTRYHGITEPTYKRFIIDAGAVYKNYGIPIKTITLTNVVAGNKLVLNGTTFTAVAASPVGSDFLVGANDTATATNLAAVIDALAGITATSNATVVTVTGSNGLTLTITTPNGTMVIASTSTATNTLIGATRDGNTFTVETEYREIPVDGAKGPVKGGQTISKVVAKISAGIVEVSTDLIKMALPGSAATNYPTVTPTHDEVRRALQIALTDYIGNIVIVGRVSGSAQPIICGVENVLSLGSFEIAEVDNDEAVIKLEFTAHFDPTNLDNEPWFIRWPKDV